MPAAARRDAVECVRRVLALVHETRTSPVRRVVLAERWGMTPRGVSSVLQRARELFGVRFRTTPAGYVLKDAGVFNVRRIGGSR